MSPRRRYVRSVTDNTTATLNATLAQLLADTNAAAALLRHHRRYATPAELQHSVAALDGLASRLHALATTARLKEPRHGA